MTPDKVEAALGVLSAIVDKTNWRPDLDAGTEALSVLTEALAESRRDTARPVNDCGRECHMIGGLFIAEDPDCPIHGKGATP